MCLLFSIAREYKNLILVFYKVARRRQYILYYNFIIIIITTIIFPLLPNVTQFLCDEFSFYV